MNKKKIGDYLKKLRNSKTREDGKKYTQANVAEEFLSKYNCDLSINAINEWENGISLPSPENLEILADMYGKTIDEILDGEDRENIDYLSVYFIADDNWAVNMGKDAPLYKIRNEQIKKIVSRFRELIMIRIERDFTANEEDEFRFLFTNFYSTTRYVNQYSQLSVNDEYLLLKDALSEMLVEIRNMSLDEKYWEVQKLYTEKKEIWFKFWTDVHDLKNVDILKERFAEIEDWQKDMLLAMFQNIEPFDANPDKRGSAYLERYESMHGEYDHDREVKSEMKELIDRGAYLNKWFFNVQKNYVESRKIIDRLEYLYDLCLKPIEIHVNHDDGQVKTYRIENNLKNRFLNRYYLSLHMSLKGYGVDDSPYDDVEEIYNWFINNDEISEDIYLKIANRENIDTNRAKKYWLADVKQMNMLDKYFNEYKSIEKEIERGLKEIKELKAKLINGEKLYSINKSRIIGGTDEDSIREYIDLCRAQVTYQDFLNDRDKQLTDGLVNDMDKLSLEDIKDKYFKMEVIKDE